MITMDIDRSAPVTATGTIATAPERPPPSTHPTRSIGQPRLPDVDLAPEYISSD